MSESLFAIFTGTMLEIVRKRNRHREREREREKERENEGVDEAGRQEAV
jgi:hypothetical protein